MDDTNKKLKIFIYILIILLIISLGGISYLLLKDNTTLFPDTKLSDYQSEKEDNIEEEISYTVLLKENTNEKTATDVYLKDNNNEETFYLTISDVYTDHYHPAEYVDGFLYIIKRVGYENHSDEDWTDELWMYNQDKEGKKIFSSKGIDFKISEDRSVVAIDTTELLVIFNGNGDQLKQFNMNDLIIGQTQEIDTMASVLAVTKGAIWVQSGDMGSLNNLLKISTSDYSQTEFLCNLGSRGEYDLNTGKEIIAYSDYPTMYDADSFQEFTESGQKVTLYLYDLNTKEKKIITTSVAKKFSPEWISADTLQFDDPIGEGKLLETVL